MWTFFLANISRQVPVLLSIQYLFKITNIHSVEKISHRKLVYHCWIKNKLLCCMERLVYNIYKKKFERHWKCNRILLCKQIHPLPQNHFHCGNSYMWIFNFPQVHGELHVFSLYGFWSIYRYQYKDSVLWFAKKVISWCWLLVPMKSNPWQKLYRFHTIKKIIFLFSVFQFFFFPRM